MSRRSTRDEFLSKAYRVHGDRYDYSQVVYINNHTKIVIICKKHGPFEQKPNGHTISKQGCPKCAGLGFTLEERFWNFVEKSNGCWKWKGSKSKDGYGMIGDGKGNVTYAHLVSYQIHYDVIPPDNSYLGRLCVLHRCDNPECTNPDHLFLGTHTDNMQDMSKKGRWKTWGIKLTWADVTKIRSMWSSGKWTQRQLSEIFNIDRSSISNIVNYKQWKPENNAH